MKIKSKMDPKLIILFFAVTALIFGNQLLKTNGTISLLIFTSGYFLIFLGIWKIVYPQQTNKVWTKGFIFLFLGMFIVFLSMWLPALLFIL
jgi:hypothetical protein